MQRTADPRAILAYIRSELGELSNRALVSEAQDLLAESPIPEWVEELAYLDATEVLDAHNKLYAFLKRDSVMPDSPAFRTELRSAVLARVAATSDPHELARKLYAMFRLMPEFLPLQVYLPIEEFPFPPVETAFELASYVRLHISELVPDGPAA